MTQPMTAATANTITSRTSALLRMGATDSAEWFHWSTASAVLDLGRGSLHIAVNYPEHDHGDWLAVVKLIRLTGYHNGSNGPHTDCPPEPVYDPIGDVDTWALNIPAVA